MNVSSEILRMHISSVDWRVCMPVSVKMLTVKFKTYNNKNVQYMYMALANPAHLICRKVCISSNFH